jgi:hypothetical protein
MGMDETNVARGCSNSEKAAEIDPEELKNQCAVHHFLPLSFSPSQPSGRQASYQSRNRLEDKEIAVDHPAEEMTFLRQGGNNFWL